MSPLPEYDIVAKSTPPMKVCADGAVFEDWRRAVTDEGEVEPLEAHRIPSGGHPIVDVLCRGIVSAGTPRNAIPAERICVRLENGLMFPDPGQADAFSGNQESAESRQLGLHPALPGRATPQ